jgi:hypothetical protein
VEKNRTRVYSSYLRGVNGFEELDGLSKGRAKVNTARSVLEQRGVTLCEEVNEIF